MTAARRLAPSEWVRQRVARWRGMISAGQEVSDDNVWAGDFTTWREALDRSTGYDDPAILDKVCHALLEVKDGRAAFERDSVLFSRAEYVWPQVAFLTRVAAEHRGRLRILDLGGSLGSSYFQHRRCFDWLDELTWSVVEQQHFVDRGREVFESRELKFFGTVAECLSDQSPQVVLLSSVLPYLEDPLSLLQELVAADLEYVLIDRTPVLLSDRPHRLTVQHVPSSVYRASYPAWFFNRDQLIEVVSEDFDLISEFRSSEGEVTLQDPVEPAVFNGWFFKRKA